MKAIHWSLLFLAFTLVAGPAAEAADDTIALPSGTELHVRLTTSLNTKTNQTGDRWMGRVIEPIFSGGREVVPADSTVDGHVTYVKEPGRVTGTGQMRVVADSVTVPDEGTFAIVTSLQEAESSQGAKVKDQEGTIQGPGKDKGDTAKSAGIGAGIGATAGVIAHGGTGALYGAGIGAAAGAIRGMVKKHKGVVLPPGTEMTFVLSRTSLSKQAPVSHPLVINQ